MTESVLRINSILMRLRILGPPWKNESKAVFGFLIFPPLVSGSAYFSGSGSGSRMPKCCGSNGSGSWALNRNMEKDVYILLWRMSSGTSFIVNNNKDKAEHSLYDHCCIVYKIIRSLFIQGSTIISIHWRRLFINYA